MAYKSQLSHFMSLLRKLFIIITLLFVAPFATAQQYYDTHNVHNNDDYFTAQWRKLKNSITNCDLELANLVPLDSLLEGISLLPQYEKGSDLDRSNTTNHHSSIDVWKLKAQANSDFFNVRDILGINVEIGKEVTYIQQFDKKMKSILRLPYNPLSKIPLKSELFFKKNEDSSLVFKEGDLLIFKAPMVLSLNKSYITKILPYINAGPSLTYGLAGVFNVQVFRMKNNFVRVTITNSLEKTVGLNYGINILNTFIPGYYILGFDVLGAVVSKNFFDPHLIQFSQATTDLVNHSYDFIFNLNSDVARQQYDSMMGPKLNLFGSKNFEILKRVSSVYKTNDQISKNLEMNFKDLVQMSNEDLSLPPEERRIITMNQGETRINTISTGMQFNVLHFFKWRESLSDTKGIGQTFESRNHPHQSYTFLSTTSSNSMDSFYKWRSRERKHTNIIFNNDEQNKPGHFKFLHQEVYEEDRTTSPDEFAKFKQLFLSDLPDAVTKKMQWPEWYADVTKRKYATLKKEIFINDKIFNSHIVITQNRAREVLKNILQTRKSFEADPMLSKALMKNEAEHYERSEVDDYMSTQDVLSKYRMEIQQLPSILSSIFNGVDILNSPLVSHYNYLEILLNKAPIVREIGIELILKSLNEDDLKKVAFISIDLAADRVAQTHYQFPYQASSGPLETNPTAYKDYVAYNQALGQFNFINDKSYRIWLYFNRDGSIIDLNQIVSK